MNASVITIGVEFVVAIFGEYFSLQLLELVVDVLQVSVDGFLLVVALLVAL